MQLLERVKSLGNIFRARPRRASASEGLAHIEFRDISLTAAVQEAERLPITRGGAPLETERDLPDDDDLREQRIVELLADIAGFWLGIGLKVLPFNPTTLGVNTVAVLSLIPARAQLLAGETAGRTENGQQCIS